MTTPASEDSPFGAKKRDWTLLWRVIMIVLSLFSAGGITICFYAGGSFVRAEAASAVREEVKPFSDLPPRVKRLEEVSADRARAMEDLTSWRRTKDEIDTRLLIILENQQKQLERQQMLIDQLASRKS